MSKSPLKISNITDAGQQQAYLEHYQTLVRDQERKIEEQSTQNIELKNQLRQLELKIKISGEEQFSLNKENNLLGTEKVNLQDQTTKTTIETNALKDELAKTRYALSKEEENNAKLVRDFQFIGSQKEGMEQLKNTEIERLNKILESNHISATIEKENLNNQIANNDYEHEQTAYDLRQTELSHTRETLEKQKLAAMLDDSKKTLYEEQLKHENQLKQKQDYHESKLKNLGQVHDYEKDKLRNDAVNLNDHLDKKKKEHLESLVEEQQTRQQLNDAIVQARGNSAEAERWRQIHSQVGLKNNIQKEELTKQLQNKNAELDEQKQTALDQLKRAEQSELERKQKEYEAELHRIKADELEKKKNVELSVKDRQIQEVQKSLDYEKQYLKNQLSSAEKEKLFHQQEAEQSRLKAEEVEKLKQYEIYKTSLEHEQEKRQLQQEKDLYFASLTQVEKEKQFQQIEADYHKKKGEESLRKTELEIQEREILHSNLIKQIKQEKDFLHSQLSKAEQDKHDKQLEILNHQLEIEKQEKEKEMELAIKQHYHSLEKDNLRKSISSETAELQRQLEFKKFELEYHKNQSSPPKRYY